MAEGEGQGRFAGRIGFVTGAASGLGRAAGAAFARGFIGRTVKVLVEDITAPGHGRGWTGEYVRMRVSAPGLKPGGIVSARARAYDESSDMLAGTVE